MEEDLDYYLAMEEDAQQEEEDWGEEGEMDIQQQTPAPSSNLKASGGAPPMGAPAAPVVAFSASKPAAAMPLSAPASAAK